MLMIMMASHHPLHHRTPYGHVEGSHLRKTGREHCPPSMGDSFIDSKLLHHRVSYHMDVRKNFGKIII